jgi:hypothetical protein
MCEGMEINRWLSTDQATFYFRVNTHNVILQGNENSHVTSELETATPKVNIWCGVTPYKVYGPFSFVEEIAFEIIPRHA